MHVGLLVLKMLTLTSRSTHTLVRLACQSLRDADVSLLVCYVWLHCVQSNPRICHAYWLSLVDKARRYPALHIGGLQTGVPIKEKKKNLKMNNLKMHCAVNVCG